ncbi:MAG: FAD-dependent oxidoreductase [Acidobacteria bacterium]|nr:FAD-dependent oxidoreductase [Acidobacteriota bacterium]MBI3472980.1 FAD-dependent oxidoreductase [Candidatus Solibacter usitatus]
MGQIPLVVLGAGPAGLGAALQLARRGFSVTVLERAAAVGGNAGSFELDGLQVDYGSHRLHPSCSPRILADIRAMLGDDLLDRPRHGRIRLRGRWLHFPLKPLDIALHAPPSFLTGVVRDGLWKPRADHQDENFATVLQQGLGPTICHDFYFPYARKIWGLDPTELDAEQARRRVSAGSIGKMVRKVLNAVPGLKPKGGGRFFYPRHGYGQISHAYHAAAMKAGARVLLETNVSAVNLDGSLVRAGNSCFSARQVLSTIPLPQLVRLMEPAAPPEILASAEALRYRAMILVYLVLETERFTEFDAHYFPGAEAPVTRLSEPKNYSLVPLPGRTVLCAELPCSRQDKVWTAGDEELGSLVTEALARFNLPVRAKVRRVAARRLPQAYPIYTRDYRRHFERLDQWAGGLDGVLTLGRQGLFAHDNTHHTLAMAYAAAECLDENAALDRGRWAEHRREFERFVVED